MTTQLMTEKLTRKQLEERLSLSGKDATSAIKDLVRAGQLQYQLDPVDPYNSKKYERHYFYVAQTVSMI